MKTSSIIATLFLVCINSFVMAQTDALTILPNGNVGVGTTTPEATLEVEGSLKTTTVTSTSNGTLNSVFLGDVGKGENWAGLSHKNAVGEKSYGFSHHVYGIISLTNIKSDPNGFIGFRVDDQDKMIIKSDGNVGIGTTTPAQKLEVNGNIQSATSLTGVGAWGDDYATFNYKGLEKEKGNYALLQHKDGTTYLNAIAGKPIYFRQGNVDKMILHTNGNVGIGTKNPTQAKLVVSGNAKHNISDKFQWFAYYQKGTGVAGGSNTIPYSIYATDRIAAQQFNAFSDARIKNIFGVSNAAKDLETLSKIEITDYTMIDTISKGNQTHKKVIAQQVKEVYPKAVTTDVTEVIPNIYAASTIKDGWIQTTTKDLVVGDKVKLIFSEEEALVEVLEIQEDAIKVASNQEGQVFIYGKQVSDFHTVDYEAIAMLNVSATQALLKRIELLEKEKETLSRKQKQLEDHLNASVSRIEKLETLFNNLK